MENDGNSKTNGSGGTVVEKKPAELIKEARVRIRNGKLKEAYAIVLYAMELYPENPVILSYCGWLQIVLDKKHQGGLALCRRAFVAFKSSDPETAGVIYPILYLNLGRAFLALGRKKDAFENFTKGLTHDRSNAELKKEIKSLGMRKTPPVPFLSRTNLVNRLLGMLRHSSSQQRALSI